MGCKCEATHPAKCEEQATTVLGGIRLCEAHAFIFMQALVSGKKA